MGCLYVMQHTVWVLLVAVVVGGGAIKKTKHPLRFEQLAIIDKSLKNINTLLLILQLFCQLSNYVFNFLEVETSCHAS